MESPVPPRTRWWHNPDRVAAVVLSSVVVVVIIVASLTLYPKPNPSTPPPNSQRSVTTLPPRYYFGTGGWGTNASSCALPIWLVIDINASVPVFVYVTNVSGFHYNTSNRTPVVTDPMYSWGPIDKLDVNVSVPVRNAFAAVFNPSYNETARVWSDALGVDQGYCS